MPRNYHGQWISCGRLLRGHFRRELIKGGYRFKEEKGFFESVFEIQEDPMIYMRLVRDLRKQGFDV